MNRVFKVQLEILEPTEGELKKVGENLSIESDARGGFRFKMSIPRKEKNHSTTYLIVKGSVDESGDLRVTTHQRGLKSNSVITQRFEIKGE